MRARPAAVLVVAAVLAACSSSSSEPAAPASPPPPEAPVVVAPSYATAGRVYTAYAGARAGMAYTWAVSDGVRLLNAGGAAGVLSMDGVFTSIEMDVGPVGTVTVTAVERNAKGDASQPGTATIVVVAPALAPAVTAPAYVTAGDPGDHPASIRPRPGSTYRWTVVGGTLTGASGAPATTFSAPATAGAFGVYCEETNEAGDSSATGEATVTALPPLAGTLVVSAPGSVAAGEVFTATVPASAGLSYAWRISKGVVVEGDGTHQVRLMAGPYPAAQPITISVTAADAAGTTATGTLDVALLAPVAPTVTAPGTVTSGAVYAASVPARPGATYAWSLANPDGGAALVGAGGGAGLAEGGLNTIRFAAGQVGTLSISVIETDAVGDVVPASLLVAVVPPALPPVLSLATSTPGKVTSTRAFGGQVGARDGFSYAWSVSNGVVVGPASGTTSNGVNVGGFVAGLPRVDNTPALLTVTCTETNAAGDSSASSSATLLVYPNPQPRPVTFSKPGGPTLTAPFGVTSTYTYWADVTPAPHMTYLWAISDGGAFGPRGGATAGEGPSVLFLAGNPGAFGTTAPMVVTVREQNELGDFADGSTTLTVYPAPIRPVISAPVAVTADGAGGAIFQYLASTPSHPGMHYQFTLSNVAFVAGSGESGIQGGGTCYSGFYAPVGTPAASPTVFTITVSELNGIGDGLSATFTGRAYPQPLAQPIQVVKQGSAVAITKLSDGSGDASYAYVASLPGGTRPGMSYLWSMPAGTPASGAGPTFAFTLGATQGSAAGTGVTLRVRETNELGDFADGTAGLTAYSGPRTYAIVTNAPGDGAGPTFQVQLGVSYAAAVSGARGGAFTYAWSADPHLTLTSETGTPTVTFVASSLGATWLTLQETNGAGDSIGSVRAGLVAP